MRLKNRIKNNKTTMIVSCFPGCGKTWCFKNQTDLGYTFFDSDSSKFKKYDG